MMNLNRYVKEYLKRIEKQMRVDLKMSNTTIEHTSFLNELYAKICFDNSMSSMQLFRLKKEWGELKKQVDKQINQVEEVKY